MDDLRGAEAIVTIKSGVATKTRFKKAYRHPDLDAKLRTGRTRREAKIMRAAKAAGAPVPRVIREDERGCTIEMDAVGGKLLARLVEDNDRGLEKIAYECGGALAKIHAAGIAHGDFSTSNVIVGIDGGVTVIDFGLAAFTDSVEEKAEDVLLFRKSLGTKQELFKQFEDAYAKENPKAKEVLQRAVQILSRARYAQ